MRLSITFNPDAPRGRNIIGAVSPSSLVDHPAIKAAIEAYEAAVIRELEAAQAAVQAEQDLGEADDLDALALAEAIEKSKADPGAKNRANQLRVIEDTRRQHKATVILLSKAIDGVNAAFEEHGDAYEASLHETYDALRGQLLRTLDDFEELVGKLRRTDTAMRIGGGSSANTFLAGIHFRRAVEAAPLEQVLAELRKVGQRAEHEQRGSAHVIAPFQTPTIEVEPENGTHGARISAQRREERMQRAAERAAQREARHQAERDAMEAVA